MGVRKISTKLAVEGEAEYKQSIASCNSELRTLKSALALVESEFRGNANSMEALTAKGNALSSMQEAQKKKVDELQRALENCQRAQETYAERVSTARENVERCERALEQLKNSTGDTSKEQAALTEELDKWQKELSEAEAGEAAASRGAQEWQRQLNSAKVELNGLDDEVEKNKKYLAEAEASADGCASSIDKYGREVKEAAEDSEDFGKKSVAGVDALASALAAAGVAATLKEIAGALMDCASAASSFETAIAKVSTLADTSAVPLDQLRAGLLELSSETGASAESLAEATYQALSAGVDTAGVVDFVATATKLSAAGFTESATAVDVLTTALNAYGLGIEQAERVASMLVKTQDLGKTSVDELAGSMGRVIPVAASYGVGLDQLTTAYAVLTASSTNTNITTTDLAGMFNELASNSSKVAGVLEEQTGKSFADLMGEGKSLGDVISLLSEYVGGNTTAFSNLWSSQTAGLAALGLLNQGADAFNETLVKMQNSSGAVERNFNIMADTTERAQQRMTTAADNFKIAVGEQLTPALEKLYTAGAAGFEWATDFVNENPWLVQALTAVTTGITVLTVGIVGYEAATKLAAVAQGVLNAVMDANPVFLLVTGITALVAAVGAFILTMGQADEETRAFTESLKESKQAYDDLSSSMEEEQENTAATAAALKELLEVEEKSEAQKAAIAEMVDNLNEAVPELGLAYDSVSDSINMTTESLDALVEHAAAQEEYEAQVGRLSELYTEQEEISARLAEAQEAYNEAVESGSWNTGTLKNNVDELTTALEENQSEIAALEEESAAYGEWQAASQQATQEMTTTVAGLVSEMESLQEEYTAAHAKAKESIEGQLGLFNELDGSAKTSIGSLLETLSGQVDYMNTYAENINKAMELGVDEGLVQKLSDGSEESAQILAAIVEGGEEEIAALNEKLAEVEEGKENFSTTVAEMETDFSDKMTDLETRLQQTVDELDISVEAGAAGSASIQGYIDGAESMRSQLVATYKSLAQAANNAYKSTLSIASPSKVFEEHGKNTVKGAVVGVERNEDELVRAIEHMGERASEAAETSLPSSIEEPSSAAATERQTAAIVRALDKRSGSGGNTYVNITSPEALDEKTAAREFKKVQRDISLGVK